MQQLRDKIRIKHYSIRTMMVYTHFLNEGGQGVIRPSDALRFS